MQLQLDDIGKTISNCLVYLFIAIFVGISQAAGIGGGPIINICLIIGLGMQTKTSMAITYIFLIGGSIASIVSNYGKKTADKSRNLIDTNLVIITLPLTVSGSIFGAIFNHFISQFIITVAFTILLSYLAYSSYKKYLDLRKLSTSKPLLPQTIVQLQQIRKKQQINPKLLEILQQQKVPFPIEKIKIFAQIIIITVMILLLKGGSSFQSIIGLQKCGTGSWICVFLHLAISIYFAKTIAYKQALLDEEKISLGYVFQKQSDKMSDQYLKKAMILGFSGGFAGGLLGIGGAIILVPAWLQMGMDKNIASSSTGPLILASAFISMVLAFLCQFYDSFLEVIFYFILGYFASYYIKQLINWIKVKYQLDGMIFILLIIVMVMSLVFLLPYSFFKMIDDPQEFFQFGHFC